MTEKNRFVVELLMAPCRRLQFNLSDMYPVPRLGIAYIASYLKSNGFTKVRLRDIIAERIWVDGLIARYREEGAPQLLGIGTTILSLREAYEIATAVKAVFPTTRVVVGGPGVGFSPEAHLRYATAVDFFVRGEGEAAMLNLAQQLSQGTNDFSAVPGLYWRSPQGATANPPAPYIDLDQWRADYESLPMTRYKLHPPMGVFPPATMLETTRGCTFPCEFCCLSMPVRYKSPARVEEEVRWLMQRFAVREIHFIDPTFTLNRERTTDIVERLRPLGLRWSCKTRVDLMPADLTDAMARSGCYLIAFGVESGDDNILASLHKKAAAEQALATFRRCREHKIRTTAYLLVANPGETDATVAGNIRFVRQLRPDYVLYDILQADPGNPLTHAMIKAGLFTLNDLERYYMTDEPTRLHEITVCGHSTADGRRWIKQASSDFYVRPAYFAQRVRDLRSLQDAANLGAGGFTFFKDLLGLGRLWKF